MPWEINASTKLRQTQYYFQHTAGYEDAVAIDSEDTDVYVEAAFVSNQVPGLLCIKRKHNTVFCRDLCNEELTYVIIPLHVMTGCDQNSGFFGHGKKQSMIR